MNGNGYVISNLSLNTNEDYAGLFGYVGYTAKLTKMKLTNVNVQGKEYVGGLVGYSDGFISQSSVTGSVNGSNYVGGLVGAAYRGGYDGDNSIVESYSDASVSGVNYIGGLVGSVIENAAIHTSYAIGTVSGNDNVGGLIGFIRQGTTSNSYATGMVSGRYLVGGLVGSLFQGTVSNNYVTGAVSGVDYVGGLLGDTFQSTVNNNYAAGAVNVSVGASYVGGLIGSAFQDNVLNSFYDKDTTGRSTGLGVGKSTADMQLETTFTGWDPMAWRILPGQYPELKSAIHLTQGTTIGTTKLNNVESGMEFSINNAVTYTTVTSSVYDNIAVNVGDTIAIRMASPVVSGVITKTIGFADIKPADSPTAALEQGSISGTTMLTGVSPLMEYKVNTDAYQAIMGTSVDNITVTVGDKIQVRIKATAQQPASEVLLLNVAEADIKLAPVSEVIVGVTSPVRGAAPVSTLPSTDEYTAMIAWSPADAKFKANTVYTATITITPKAGYTLSGVSANFFTVAGATATNAANSGAITAVFPATASNTGGGESPVVPSQPPVSQDQTPVTPEPSVEVFQRSIVNEADLVQTYEFKTAEAREVNKIVDFADTKGHWSEQTIDIFVQLKLINGYPDGSFKPDEPITRAEFASLLNRVFQIQGNNKSNTDIKDIDGIWAKEDIENLVAARVINGYTDSTFKPNQTITREEMVVMLSRIVILSNVEKDSTKGHFNDLKGTYAADEITAAAQASIVSGKGNASFQPKSSATRAEALQIMLNVLKLNSHLKTLLEYLN